MRAVCAQDQPIGTPNRRKSSTHGTSDKGGRKAARSRAARQLEYERKRASENNGGWDCQRSTRLYEKHRPSVLIGDHSWRIRPTYDSQIPRSIGSNATTTHRQHVE